MNLQEIKPGQTSHRFFTGDEFPWFFDFLLPVPISWICFTESKISSCRLHHTLFWDRPGIYSERSGDPLLTQCMSAFWFSLFDKFLQLVKFVADLMCCYCCVINKKFFVQCLMNWYCFLLAHRSMTTDYRTQAGTDGLIWSGYDKRKNEWNDSLTWVHLNNASAYFIVIARSPLLETLPIRSLSPFDLLRLALSLFKPYVCRSKPSRPVVTDHPLFAFWTVQFHHDSGFSFQIKQWSWTKPKYTYLYTRHDHCISDAAAFCRILSSRCFSISARIRFSSGGIISASERTPTINAVWNIPNNDERQTSRSFIIPHWTTV